MSGECYGWRERRLQEIASDIEEIPRILDSLALILHTVNWGDSGDSCKECGELRALAGLRAFGEDNAALPGAVKEAIANEPGCASCQKWRANKEP